MAVKPVIFIALANERIDQPNYLRGLVKEKELIQEALEPAIVAGLCELVIESHSSIKTLIDTFQNQRFKDRIAIFHFAGHADDFQLMLESNEGETIVAHSEGLIPFLSKQASLKLIFLNACSTQLQSEALVEAGIPLLIGTSQTVSDKVALQLSGRFYKGLGQGMQIGQAWTEAEAEVKMETGATRAMDFSRKKEHTDQLPWRVYVRKGSEEVKNWSLPLAAGNPLFGLPDISRTQDLPDVPYRYLQRFEKAQSQIFFGRGTYIRDLYARALDRHRAPLLLLYGQSGVGKSSLLEAGLLPRLEQKSEVHYVRRNPEKGLIHALVDIFGLAESIEAETLKSALVTREQETAQPVTIILDQVEESLISPFEKGELESFMQLLAGVFSIYAERPQGKLILAYRKEFHPEIEELCKTLEIAHENIFINKFKRRDIIEIIEGLTSSDALCQKYKLEIEFNLPEIIADDLLVDQDSSIAPILQILLTKMWEQSKKGEGHHFKIATYNKLQKEGILLDDFYKEQMQKLQEWKPEVGKSGLALDLLYYHTTELATASSRKLEDISRLYAHQKDILEEIIQKFTDLFLLSRPGKNTSVLAHDTLAPLIQQKQRNADYPGQRAFRILESKKIALENKDEGFIDEDDLTLVEAGKNGMRKWDEVEEELVKRSQKRRDDLVKERKRTTWFKRIAVGLLAAAAVVIAIFGRNQYKSAKANALITHAVQLEEKDPTVALRLAEEALKIQPENENAQQVLSNIFNRENFYSQVITHLAPVSSVTYSPDGQNILSGSEDGTLRLWDLEGKELTVFRGHTGAVNKAVFSLDGEKILSGGDDRMAILWDKKGKELLRIQDSHYVKEVAFFGKGDTLITGNMNGLIQIWNQKGDSLGMFNGHSEEIRSIDISSSGSILSGSSDSTVQIWRLDKLDDPRIIRYPHAVLDAIFSPKGESVLLGGEDGKVSSWSNEGIFEKDYSGHRGQVNALVFLPDGERFLSASSDNTIRLWTIAGKELGVYKGHSQVINSLDINPSAEFLLSAGKDNKVLKWRLSSKTQKVLATGEQEVLGWTMGEEAELFISASRDGLKLWDNQGNLNTKLGGHEDQVNAVFYSEEQGLILSAGNDGQLILWDDEGNQNLNISAESPLGTSAISPDGSLLLASNPKGEILIWDRTPKLLRSFMAHKGGVKALVFSSDGKYILTGGVNGLSKYWDLSGRLIQTFSETDETSISVLAMLPGDQHFISGNANNEIKRWKTEGDLLQTYHGHEPDDEYFYGLRRQVSAVTALGTNHKKGLFLSGGIDNKVLLWNLEGKEIQRITGHTNDIKHVSFSPDGNYIRSGDKDGNIRISYTLFSFMESGNIPQLDLVMQEKYQIKTPAFSEYLAAKTREELRAYASSFESEAKTIQRKSQRLDLLDKSRQLYKEIFLLPQSGEQDKIDASRIWLQYAESSLFAEKYAQSIEYYLKGRMMNPEEEPTLQQELAPLAMAYVSNNQADKAWEIRKIYLEDSHNKAGNFLSYFRKVKLALIQENSTWDTIPVFKFEQRIKEEITRKNKNP